MCRRVSDDVSAETATGPAPGRHQSPTVTAAEVVRAPSFMIVRCQQASTMPASCSRSWTGRRRRSDDGHCVVCLLSPVVHQMGRARVPRSTGLIRDSRVLCRIQPFSLQDRLPATQWPVPGAHTRAIKRGAPAVFGCRRRIVLSGDDLWVTCKRTSSTVAPRCRSSSVAQRDGTHRAWRMDGCAQPSSRRRITQRHLAIRRSRVKPSSSNKVSGPVWRNAPRWGGRSSTCSG
jgi:hypothetical protein